MNPEDPNSDWQKLLRRARADTPPPINRVALKRVIHEAAAMPTVTMSTWSDELIALFGSPRALFACSTLCVAIALFASWEMQDVSASLSWAQLAGGLPGGEP